MREILKMMGSILLFFIGFLLTQMLVSYSYSLFPILLDIIPDTVKALIMKLCYLPPAFLLWHFVEKKPIITLGLPINTGVREFLSGAVLGILSTASIVLFLAIFQTIQLHKRGVDIEILAIIPGLVLAFGTALGEEIMVRGYITGAMGRFKNAFVTLFVPAILFSLMHFFNSGFQWIGALNTFLVGVVFTYMSYKTGNLWMAVGFHMLWNWSLSGLFSLSVSGGGHGYGLLNFVTVRESILGTTAYGPEGGILCTFILIILLFLVKKCCRKSKKGDCMKFPSFSLKLQ